ncbi:hypothetical protein [Reinekea sp.]|jgi:hypothetical protein|uniref:hypothetical protein n=1 Tax=Reinekea sp. TaxID=1970455 RepID=UPI003989D7A2
MAELHSNLYVKHADPKIHALFQQLFSALGQSPELLVDIAEQINVDDGQGIMTTFLESAAKEYGEIYPESVWATQGYHAMHLVSGSSGDYLTGALVKLFADLDPSCESLGWGCGDDDPWEFWFKWDAERVIRKDDQPYEGDDQRIKDTIYRWWHEGLPEEFLEGFLNNDEDDEEDEEDFEDEDESDSEPMTEAEYQNWVSHLRGHARKSAPDDQVAQGLESPISGDDVKEALGALGDIFGSIFGGQSTSSETETSSGYNQLDKDTVSQAQSEYLAGFDQLDAPTILKFVSPKLTGQIEMIEDDQTLTLPSSYAMYKMGVNMMVKPKMQMKQLSNQWEIASIEENAITTRIESVVQYVDPEQKVLIKTANLEVFTWKLIEGELKITDMHSKELSKEVVN